MVNADEAQPLGWTYRLGAWYDTKSFGDQRTDENGLSLANPASDGVAQSHKGNYAVYAVADRLIWRDATDPNRTVAAFTRIMGTPLSDRNLIDFSLNAGLTFHSPLTYRTTDTLGLGLGYAHVSKSADGLDRDANNFNATTSPVRSGETFVEMTYQYQYKPWIQIQPDLQYVFNPGAGVADPNDATKRISNELVLGVRTNISF
jgi:porin